MDTKKGIKNRIILESLREVPQEIIFSSLKAKKDQVIPNRYHFRFPEQWSNQLDKDAIIGIRSCYMVKQNRYLVFNLNVKVYSIDNETQERIDWLKVYSKQHVWLEANETMEKIPKILEEFWFVNVEGYLFYETLSDESKELLFNKDLIDCWFLDGKLFFGRLPHKNKLIIEDKDGNEYECHLEIILEPINDDAKNILNLESQISSIDDELVLDNIYSRHQLYLTSSISNDTEDNFLGHTKKSMYIPIKYYRLTSESKSFWVDLWDTRNHSVKIELPKDNKDIFYIEGIVCFNSSAMI